MKRVFVCSTALLLTLSVGQLEAQTDRERGSHEQPSRVETKQTAQLEQKESEMAPIRGRVLTLDGLPLSLATIALLGEDGTLLDGSVADEDGGFALAKNTQGGKSLRIQMLGYETEVVDLPALTEPLEIRLRPASKTLQAVEVQGRNRSAVRFSGTSLVASVASTSLASLPSITHILSALPFVTATATGVQVQGRGTPIVYFGNRLLTYEELLRLNPDDIKDIEVILIPDASYPSGTAAVIKIQPKSVLSRRLGVYTRAELNKEKALGYAAMAQGYYDSPKLSLKLGTQSKSDATYNEQDLKTTITDESRPTTSTLHNEVNVRNTLIALWTDAVYRLREGHELGAKYTLASLMGLDVSVPIEGEIIRSTGEHKRYTSLMTKSQVSPLMVNYANLYYHGVLSPQWTLHAEGTFNQKKQHFTQNQEIRYTEPAGQTDSDHSHTRSVGNNWSWRAYAQYAFGRAKLQLGQDGSLTTFAQSYRQLSDAHKVLLPDIETKQAQSNLGLFASWSHSWLESLSTELGLRLEHQERLSMVGGKERSPERQLYLFPSASISYTKGKLSGSLSYENIVRNPYYEALSAEIMYVDELMLQSGNPNLRPMITNRLSLNLGYGDWTLSSSLEYRKDEYTRVMRRYERNPRFVINRDENYDITTYQVSLVYSPKIGIWRPTWTADLYGQDLYFEGVSYRRPRFYLHWKNLLSLPYAITLQANLWASLGGHNDRTLYKPRYTLDLSVSKQIGKAWRLALSADDLFLTGTRCSIQNEPIGVVDQRDIHRYPRLSLSVSYNFQAKGDRYRGGTAGAAERSRF